MVMRLMRKVRFHALWCYNIGKTCCGGEACHLDEQNPRCLEDWENLDFQDLVVDGECFQVEVHCCRGKVLLLMLTNKGWVDGNDSNPGGGFGKPRGGRETRGGDGLEGLDSQLSMRWILMELEVVKGISFWEEMKEFSHLVVHHLRIILAVFLLKFGEFILDELVIVMN
ncbi:hypothetical protein Tco_1416126 [Tanacetum coccineum]